jgi:hypothetical protein
MKTKKQSPLKTEARRLERHWKMFLKECRAAVRAQRK